ARAVDDGAAFVDARGAIWLPGGIAGPGPLRRRAELFALKAELIATEHARHEAMANADSLRAAVQESERQLIEASAALEAAQVDARRAVEHHGELERRRQRAEREVNEADGLAARLQARQDELTRQLAYLDEDSALNTRQLAGQDTELATARERLTAAERTQEEAREARTRMQVEVAQAQARLQVTQDRERRLAEEQDAAVTRLHALQSELS